MTNTISANKVGLAFGGLLGLWHLLWSLLVAFGLAQPLLDWIFELHMISPPYMVLPFSFSSASMLVVVTTVFGYVVGYACAIIWNNLPQK